MKIALLLVYLFLVSCATKYYTPVKAESSATVSFSNLSPEIPEINITVNCNTSKIEGRYIENKKPTDKSSNRINVPAKRKLTFEYNYFWVSGERNQLVTSGKLFSSKIETQKSKEVSMCSEKVTFIPEEDRHYEIYFGKNLDKCIIKASQVYFSTSKPKKVLLGIKLVSNQEC